MTNDHGKKTVTHKRDNPVARVSIDLVLLMGKTVKEEGRGRRVGRHKKERVEERRTIKDREQTDMHWKSALGRDTSNAGVYGPCPCRRIVKLMYSWDNYFLHSLRGCKVFIGPEPGPAKHEAPLQSRSSEDGPPPPLLVPPSLPPLPSPSFFLRLRHAFKDNPPMNTNRIDKPKTFYRWTGISIKISAKSIL